MASVKNLKKDINYTLGDIIGVCDLVQLDPAKAGKAEAIIDETINVFDALITKVNANGVENKKAHYKAIGSELEVSAKDLVAKLNKL
ncbi:MAG: hypothetical protein ACI9SI_000893 [Polaribacter sp.]|jgi:hypothetical protein